MIYKVLKIEEDIDFGCEERRDGDLVKAVVTLEDENGAVEIMRLPDSLLYEKGVEEECLISLDEEGKSLELLKGRGFKG